LRKIPQRLISADHPFADRVGDHGRMERLLVSLSFGMTKRSLGAPLPRL
jgi:hypothetical protein